MMSAILGFTVVTVVWYGVVVPRLPEGPVDPDVAAERVRQRMRTSAYRPCGSE